MHADRSDAKPNTGMLVLGMCVAQVLGMLGVFTFSSLLPHFLQQWQLSNSEAGWINGIYFAGYTLAVPLLASLTDRIDARRIYISFSALGLVSSLGFALFADGFWSALCFRALSGLGLAGTFIPGLKALIDRLPASVHPRAIAFYTACFGLGMSVSFYCAGEVFRAAGWQAAFVVAAMGSAVACLLAMLILRPMAVAVVDRAEQAVGLFNFRPVWENRLARAYILAYMCHMWEMFAARSWLVVFLTYSISRQSGEGAYMAPTTVMAIAGIGGMLASIVGGELAVMLGRRRVVTVMMAISCLLAFAIGFSASLPYLAVVFLCIVYTLFFQGDSAAIHAGVIAAAPPQRRGTTMALQSMAGFAAASLGALVAGILLDISGGGVSTASWVITFGSLGLVAALGPVLLHRVIGSAQHDA